MAGKDDNDKQLRCSFCNKPQDKVKKLIAGDGVYICDECVEVCAEIVEDELYANSYEEAPSLKEDINLLKPMETGGSKKSTFCCSIQSLQKNTYR